MTAILDAIDTSLTGGRLVYVHCWGGVGRTGTVVGCWLLRHGLATRDAVLDTLAQLRQHTRSPSERNPMKTATHISLFRVVLAIAVMASCHVLHAASPAVQRALRLRYRSSKPHRRRRNNRQPVRPPAKKNDG